MLIKGTVEVVEPSYLSCVSIVTRYLRVILGSSDKTKFLRPFQTFQSNLLKTGTVLVQSHYMMNKCSRFTHEGIWNFWYFLMTFCITTTLHLAAKIWMAPKSHFWRLKKKRVHKLWPRTNGDTGRIEYAHFFLKTLETDIF